jgi:LacI family transcriptional regulator
MKPQAMLLAGSRLGPPAANEALDVELGRYVRSGGRVVVVGDDELNHDSVVLPRRLGAYDLVVALAERGYRNASLIDYDSDSTAGRAWLEGIADAARQTGMRIDHSPEPVLSGSREAGQAAMAALIQTSNDIDVVIASTDMLAIGAMRAMRQAGIEPGSGLAVAGFGNALNSSDVLPSLTTVDLSLAKAGVAAVDLAVGAAGPQPVRLAVDARVLIRDSTPER